MKWQFCLASAVLVSAATPALSETAPSGAVFHEGAIEMSLSGKQGIRPQA